MTEKQRLWMHRSQFLWRLKGSYIHIGDTPVTKSERDIMSQINSLRQELLGNFTNSSRELGFNAKERCSYIGCNNIAKYYGRNGGLVCKKHFKEENS